MAQQRADRGLRYLHTLFKDGTAGGLGDGELLERFAAHEGGEAESAFAVLVERHGLMVHRVCRASLGDPHDAEDAFQATFLVLARKAGSLRVRDSIGPWLHAVALRVASCARSAARRRGFHERRKASLSAVASVEPDPDDLAPVLYEEIGRLPKRERAAVLLCYLEGRTHDEAAGQLGWPVGTVRSRLARARARLRARLERRGVDPRTDLLVAMKAAEFPSVVVSPVLAEAAVRDAIAFRDGVTTPWAGAGCSARAMTWTEAVLKVMSLTRPRLMAAMVLVALALGGGLLARDLLPTRTVAMPAGDPPVAKAESLADIRHVDRLDLGTLHVGALAEAELRVGFRGDAAAGLAIRVEPPPFMQVKAIRVWRRDRERAGDTDCSISLSADTGAARETMTGPIRVGLGSREAIIPVTASVVPARPEQTRVLVISGGFGSASTSAEYLKPWFQLVKSEGLDVSYMDAYGGLNDLEFEMDGRGGMQLPALLSRYDVILEADGGPVFLNERGAAFLRKFVESGKRLIIVASPFMSGSVLKANTILDDYGLHMRDEEQGRVLTIARGNAIAPDPLTEGVKELAFRRPARVEGRGPTPGKILVSAPDQPGGFVAVARRGRGEVVALGVPLLMKWIGEAGETSDQLRLLGNLLKVAPKP